MQRRQKNRTNAMEAVYRFCLENSIVWQGIVAIATAVTALGLKITTIVNTEAKQQRDNKGVTLTKEQLKSIMLGMGSSVAGAMQAYCKTVNNMGLYVRFNFVESALMSGSSSNAISATRLVYNLANDIATATRTPYGVTDAVLESLDAAITNFEENGNSAPRNAKVEKSALTAQLHTLVNEGCDIMRNEVIKLSRQLREDNPEFYMQLKQNSRIINQTISTKLRIDAFDDVTEQALAGVNIVIDGTADSDVTNSKGKCLIYLKEGDYSITATKENFITMKMNVKVKKGSNTIKIQLVPQFDIPAEVKETVLVEK